MLWRDALIAVIKQRMDELGVKPTKVTEDSQGEIPRNFFTRLFRGETDRIDPDKDLEPLAKVLGYQSALDLLQLAAQKKTA